MPDIITIDLSHIYHRPGELFWKENDPFQDAVPCWQAYISASTEILRAPFEH